MKHVGDDLAAAAFAPWKGSEGGYAEVHFETLKALLDAEEPGYAA